MAVPPDLRHHIDAHPALALIGHTPLVELHTPGPGRVFAKAEFTNPGGSIKDRPVLRMLLEALESGALQPDQTLIDSSSGNAGIAYAMIGAALGLAVELVIPGNASAERKQRIRAHGATLIQTDPLEGYDEALREAHRRVAADPGRYFMPDQYANAANWRAHHDGTAAEILEQTGCELTHFVSGIGTGGTITGVGRRLKAHAGDGVQVVALRPDRFPGIEGLKPLDDPADIVPAILDRSVVDRYEDVTIEDAFDECQALAKQGLFVGQSSGANVAAAHRIAREQPDARIVTILADTGERYFSTRLWDV